VLGHVINTTNERKASDLGSKGKCKRENKDEGRYITNVAEVLLVYAPNKDLIFIFIY